MGKSFHLIHLLKLLLCSILVANVFTFAHGSASADVCFEVLFDSTGLVGVRNHWTFDKEYSMDVINSVDINGNGVFEEKELPILQKVLVDTLLESNYYNYVLSGSHFLDAQGVSNFKAFVKSGKLAIDFIVNFSEPAVVDYTLLVVVVYDTHSKMIMNVDTDGAKVVFPKNLNVEFFPDGLNGITMLKAFDSSVRGMFLRFKKNKINMKK